MSYSQAPCIEYSGKLVFVWVRQALRFDGCVENVMEGLLSKRRFPISATKVWLMLFLYAATTVQDSTQDAGNGYHLIWCATQMHRDVFPQSTAPTLYKGRFCIAQTCRTALLREDEVLHNQIAYICPRVTLRPGVWAEEAAEQVAEASHEA